MFQWVNVKGWVMVIGTITAYAAHRRLSLEHRDPGRAEPVAGQCVDLTWTLFGSSLRPILTSPRAVRAFNIVMAVLLLASLYPVFMDA